MEVRRRRQYLKFSLSLSLPPFGENDKEFFWERAEYIKREESCQEKLIMIDYEVKSNIDFLFRFHKSAVPR